MNANSEQAAEKFGELVRIMERLRGVAGCPWDRKQSFETLKTYVLEEAYEVMDAIDARDWPGLAEELGDLLLQPVFLAEMAREEGLFNIADSLDAISQKLIRRHPHIFGNATAETAEDVKLRWDAIKSEEKKQRGIEPAASLLDGVPRSLPALMEADKIGQHVAKVGFEWPNVDGVIEKLQEEAAELAAARANKDQREIEHEIGDLLFNVVNLARYLHVDPEQALRKTNARFRARFGHIERKVNESGATLEQTPLDRMEEFWQAAKRDEH